MKEQKMAKNNLPFKRRGRQNLPNGYVIVNKSAKGQYVCTIPKKIAELTHMENGSIICFTRIETNKIKIDVANKDYPIEDLFSETSTSNAATK
jgi:hypothetical protein